MLVIATGLFDIIVVPPDEPLTLGPVVIASVAGAADAAIAGQLTRRPIHAFLIIAGAALLLSFLPIAC